MCGLIRSASLFLEVRKELDEYGMKIPDILKALPFISLITNGFLKTKNWKQAEVLFFTTVTY